MLHVAWCKHAGVELLGKSVEKEPTVRGSMSFGVP